MKKEMLKKVGCLVLGAAMIGGITSGCTKKETNGDIPTLTWYVPGGNQEDMALVMEEVNKIIEPKVGARLNLQMIDAGVFNEKIAMLISSRQEFDICFTGYCNPYKSSVELGAYVPMLDLMKEYAPKLWESIPEYVWDVAYIENEIYAVPNMQIMSNVGGVFFFKDIADKYGITSDMKYETIEDLEPYLEKIKQGEPDMYPFTTMPSDVFYRDYWLIHQAPNMYLDKETLKIIPLAEMEEKMQELAKAREWYEKGYIRPDIDTAIQNKETDLKAGKYAGDGMRWKPGIEVDYKNRYGREIVFVPNGITEVAGGLDTMTAISKTSKYPEKAMQIIEMVNTDKEVYNLIAWGIEGKHYEKLEGEYIKPIKDSGYSQLAAWKFGNQFNSYLLEGQDPDVWEITRKVNDEGEVPATRGFAPDETSIKSYEAQCNAISGEYSNLNRGSVENWEEKQKEYNDRLNIAGQQTIREELQKQFDEWYAAKNANK